MHCFFLERGTLFLARIIEKNSLFQSDVSIFNSWRSIGGILQHQCDAHGCAAPCAVPSAPTPSIIIGRRPRLASAVSLYYGLRRDFDSALSHEVVDGFVANLLQEGSVTGPQTVALVHLCDRRLLVARVPAAFSHTPQRDVQNVLRGLVPLHSLRGISRHPRDASF